MERGRASWAKFPEVNATPPVFHTFEARWLNLKMGPEYPVPYAGNRFPTAYYDQLMMQGVPRWITSDGWTMEAYEQYLRRMQQTTDGVILLAHSQGGLFALNAALACPQNVKAIVLIESSSTLDVTQTDVSSLKDIPFLFVWGDFLGEAYRSERYTWIGDFAYTKTMRSLHEKILDLGGCSQWLHLPEMGIRGNTHAMMIEDNSRQIADMVCDWLKAQLARPARL